MKNESKYALTTYHLQDNKPHLSQVLKKAKNLFDTLDVSIVTRNDYKSRIHLFVGFTKKYGLNRDTFLEFKQYLAARNNLSVATKSKYFTTARVFLKELNRQGYLGTDITQNIKGFSQSKKHRRAGFSDGEVARIMLEMNQLESNPKNARLKAFIALLAFQGLRQIEITHLNAEDIDLINKTAFVQGKGRDDKEIIHLHPQTILALEDHIHASNVKSGALFTSLGNKSSHRIQTITIKREVKRLTQPLGIDKTPHGFRHFYITTLLKNLPMRDVRKFSRHNSLEMLIVYDDEIDMRNKAREVFACFSPFQLDCGQEEKSTL
jgi:integrase